jgi:hypothetical protein
MRLDAHQHSWQDDPAEYGRNSDELAPLLVIVQLANDLHIISSHKRTIVDGENQAAGSPCAMPIQEPENALHHP